VRLLRLEVARDQLARRLERLLRRRLVEREHAHAPQQELRRLRRAGLARPLDRVARAGELRVGVARVALVEIGGALAQERIDQRDGRLAAFRIELDRPIEQREAFGALLVRVEEAPERRDRRRIARVDVERGAQQRLRLVGVPHLVGRRGLLHQRLDLLRLLRVLRRRVRERRRAREGERDDGGDEPPRDGRRKGHRTNHVDRSPRDGAPAVRDPTRIKVLGARDGNALRSAAP
jgi:hypothetical protein